LVNRKKLAKASSSPGKTETINHYLVNKSWYLVDLPGYGYAKKSKADRDKWIRFINKYMHNRQNLACVFLLVDGSIPPQKIDLEFMYDLGVAAIPFAIVLTKTDRLSKTKLKYNIKNFEDEISKNWEALPEMFISSAKNKSGRVEILTYIHTVNKAFHEKFS
jgi:GTP-binding protein